jgi:hypothetical protein
MLLLWFDTKTFFMNELNFLMTDCGKDTFKEYSTSVLSAFIIKNGSNDEPL